MNSSSAYGLTIGGYRDENISITPRGEACTTPRTEEERQTALLEAALAPDVFRKFYKIFMCAPQHYNIRVERYNFCGII